jgi:YbbR domain-containing protein
MLSFFCAFALWVFVSYTQNPDRRTRFDDIPVETVGLGPGLIIVDNNGLPRTTRPTVNVTIEAPAQELQNVSERDIQAFVDATSLQAGQYVLDVQVQSNRLDRPRLQFTPDPFRLPLRIDQEITRTIAITIGVQGIVPFSYEAGDPQLTSNERPITTANVRGPANRVEDVAAVRTSVNIDRLTSTYNSPRTLEAVTEDGRVVDGVTIDPPQVNVQVPIVSSVGSKRVPIVPQLIGEPASGFVVTGVSVDPQLVTLTGSSGPLDAVQNISTAPINITNSTGSISRTVGLLEPDGVRVRFGEPVAALVSVMIEPLEQSYQVTLPIPVQVTGVADGLLVNVSPPIVSVRFQGRPSALSGLAPEALQAVASVHGLGPGVYAVDTSVTLPENSGIVAESPKITVTLRAPPTAVPTEVAPTGTPAPETTATAPPDGQVTPAPTAAQPAPTPAATAAPEPGATPTPASP